MCRYPNVKNLHTSYIVLKLQRAHKVQKHRKQKSHFIFNDLFPIKIDNLNRIKRYSKFIV